MNWSEGVLFRHSRPSRGREVLLHQKEYFAKVRAGKLSAKVKTSPPSIPFVAHPALSSLTSETSDPSSSKKRNINRDSAGVSHFSPDDDRFELPTVADFQEVQVEEEALRQKRRKLLLKADWTGIDLQKPIEMKFYEPRPSRGGPWGYSKSRYAKSKSKMCHVLGIKCNAGQARGPKISVKATGTTSPVQIRVRVGSRERVFGGSSNVSPRSRTCRDVRSSPQVFRNSESTHDDRQPTLTSPGMNSVPIGERQSPKLPELLQPVPQRPFPPSLFRYSSSSSSDAASTNAQVGVLKPEIPASLVQKNEAWWRYVGGAEHDQSASDLHPSNREEKTLQRKVSPGISQLGLQRTVGDAVRETIIVETPGAATTKTDWRLEPSAQKQKDILAIHELGSFLAGSSEDADTILLDDVISSSSMGSGPLPSMEDWKAGEHVAPAHQSSLHDADEVSMQVMPTSCSPTSEDLLSHFNSYTDPRDHIDDVSMPSIPSEPLSPEIHHELLELPHLQKNATTDQEQLPKPPDNSELWRNIAFDDRDLDVQALFEEARKETARNLLPSDPPTSTGGNGDSHTARLCLEPPEMITALHKGPSADVPNITNQYDSSSTEISSMAPVSYIATFGDSSSDPLSAHAPSYTDRTLQTDEATVGSSSSPKNLPLSLVDNVLTRSDAWSLVTDEQDNTTSLVAHPPSASEHSEADESFKFARPRPFLGKKKAHLDEQRQIALSAPQIRGKGRTWRRQKRTKDGRTSIRHVPDFSSDPIEEVEDAMPAKGAHKPALIGPLDTVEGFC